MGAHLSQISISDHKVGEEKLVEQAINGDLLDPEYLEQIKQQHDVETVQKNKERLLAERQIYLMQKRQAWIEDDRQIKLLEIQAQKIDKDETLADSRFKEQIQWESVWSRKVEDWFAKNKVSISAKNVRKHKNKDKHTHRMVKAIDFKEGR